MAIETPDRVELLVGIVSPAPVGETLAVINTNPLLAGLETETDLEARGPPGRGKSTN